MAENTNTNAAPAPQTGATSAEPSTTTAQVFSTSPAQYDPVNGQQAKAADITAKSQIAANNASPEHYAGGLQGSEHVAKNIVDATQTEAAKPAAYNGINSASDQDLNNVTPAAGQPMGKSGAPNVELNSQTSYAAATTLSSHVLNKPTAGHTETVKVSANEVITTKFDPNTADLSMHGKDLVMSFNDGSKIVLQHFADDSQHMPSIALPNGALVAGGIIVAQLEGTTNIFNLETAAGGGGAGHAGAYSDDFGHVIGLLDKLPPIPFTALTFGQPEPRVVDAPHLDTVGGHFTPNFDTPGGEVSIQGGFEDWQPNQNTLGSITNIIDPVTHQLTSTDIHPMALNINFVPNDNEVVDKVTISNIPTGVQIFFDDGHGFQPMTITNGTLTFTGAQMQSGHIYVLPPTNSDQDIPVKITLDIHDPDNGLTAVISQNVTAVVDAVADQPVITSTISLQAHSATTDTIDSTAIGTSANITGSESNVPGQVIALNVDVKFPDNDGSEVHTITLKGVPADWTLNSSPGLTFGTPTTEADGTHTFTVNVTGNVNSTLSFDPHGWTDNAGDAHLTLTARAEESVTDGEITTANNVSEVSTQFDIHINEDIPTIVTPNPNAGPSTLLEANLTGVDQVNGHIKVDFHSDIDAPNPATVKLTVNGLPTDLTSHGHSISYTITPDGKTITATDDVTHNTVFTVALGTPTNTGGTQTVDYTFTLHQPLDHQAGNGNNEIDFPVKFIATDSDGDVANGSFKLGVIDDVPVAHDDHASIADGTTVATGNVITGDNEAAGGRDTLSQDAPDILQNASHGGVTKSFATPDGTDLGGKFVTLQGDYGTLKIYQDGHYTYTYDSSHPAGNYSEQFKYTLVDFDGDTSTANLDLSITDAGPGAPPAVAQTIDETTDIGKVIGGDVIVTHATQFGLTGFTAGGSETAGHLSSNGSPISVALVNGQYVGTTADGKTAFTMSIDNNGHYTFTQTAPLDHADGTNPNDIINLTFNYTAKDGDGDSVSNTITINVKDDAPVAVADTNNIPDGASTATGNVITNDTLSKDVVNVLKDASFNGASHSFASPDGTDAGGKFVLVNGQYGVLKIYENGNYTYTYDNAHNTGNHTEQFKYTLVDHDGDTSQTTLTLGITDAGPGAPPAVVQTIDETTDIGKVIGGDVVVTHATQFGLTGFTAGGSETGGHLSSDGSPITVNLVNGQYVGTTADGKTAFTMSIDNNGHYTFTQTAPLDHADGTNPNDIINLTFNYTAKDSDGDSVSNTITINVKDDAPLAVADINNIPDGSSTASGNVVTNDVLSKDIINVLKDASFGGTTKSFATPDGTDTGGKYVLINGTYGVLKIYENGNYTYTYDNAHNTGNHTEQFKYTLVDHDGDTSATTLTLNITDNGPGAAPAVEKTVDETTDLGVSVSDTIVVANATQFALGTNGTATFSANGSETAGHLTSNGVAVTVSLINGQYVGMAGGTEVFRLSIDNSGHYTFTQKAPLDHADGTNPNDIINLNFAYTAKDGDGDSVSNSITVHVRDDAPIAHDDHNSVPDGTTVATGNVITGQNEVAGGADTLSHDVINQLLNASANGVTKSFATPDGTDAGGKYVTLQGDYGQLKIYQDGHYTYTYDSAAHGPGHDSFSLPSYALAFPLLSETSNIDTHLTLDQIATLVKTADAMEINYPTTVSVDLVKSDGTVAGYSNGLGAFTLNDNGTINNVDLLFGNATANANNPLTGADMHATYNMSSNEGRVVFFIVQNGLAQLQSLGLADSQGRATDPAGSLSMVKQADGTLHLVYTDSHGHATEINATIYTSEQTFNGDHQAHTIAGIGSDGTPMFGFEDLTGTAADGSDRDFNDVMFKVNVSDRYTPGGDFDDVFSYTLIDKDGDTSQANLDFHITDTGPGTPPAVTHTIDETTDIGKSITDIVSVDGATAFHLGGPNNSAPFSATGSVNSGGLKSDGVPVTVTIENGQYVGKAGSTVVFTLTIDSTGHYTFTQKAALDHADGNDPNDAINLKFAYTASDADGDSVANTITIVVKDDAPLAVADTNSIADNTSTASGNVITNDTLSHDAPNSLKDASFGGTTKSFATADGSDASGKYVLLNGAYGQLKIYQDGHYTYTYDSAHNSGNHTEQFKYTLVDSDGDTSSTTLTLGITDNGPGAPPAVSQTIDETTDIGTAVGGTIAVAGATQYALGNASGAATFTAGGSETAGHLTSNGVAVTVALVGGQYVGTANGTVVFTLSIDNTGHYSFTQKAPLDHADGTNPNDIINLNFTYTAKDGDGDAVSNTIMINVKDDAPIAVADTNNIPNNASTATGNVVTNDTLSKDVVNVLKDASFNGVSHSFASPDGTDAGGKFVLVNGQYGVLKIYENGNYTYTYDNAHNSGNHTEQFKYTLVDHDGDTSSTTLTLGITDNGPGTAPAVVNQVDETTDINHAISGDIAVSGANAFALGAVNGALGFTSDGSQTAGHLTSNGVAVTVTLVGGQYVGMAGGTEVFRLAIDNSGHYTFTQKAPLDHADGSNPNDVINLNFTYTARDSDGDAVESSIAIHVLDDAPVAHADINSVIDSSTATGNVITGLNGGAGAADTLSHDVANSLKSISQDGVTKSFATDGMSDAGGKYVVLNGHDGVLKIYDNGNYSYTLNSSSTQPGNGGTHSDVFNYTLQDKDGDISSSTLTLNAALPKLIVGDNVNDNSGSTTTYVVGGDHGVITGNAASDILIGDRGGATTVTQTKDYNISLMLDVSGSMAGDKLALLKTAVDNLLADFHNYKGGDVKVNIVPFDTNSLPAGTFDLSTTAGYNAAVNFVNGMQVGTGAAQYTNYEAPLQSALNWYNGTTSDHPIAGAENFTYFVSDGDPNRYMNGSTVAEGSVDTIMGNITGSDGTNEVASLQHYGQVVSVGIGVDSVTIGRLDVIDTNHNALDVHNPADLSAALQGVSPINQLGAVGNDTITGGDGNNLIFGDSLNTDKLAHDLGLTSAPGKGWDVFADLEANHGWTRAQTISYIHDHAQELAAESHNNSGVGRTGGDDTITSGSGNDIIFAQEGNDTVNAGGGNDIISGGSGNNVLTGGDGADTFLFVKGATGHDTITDYSTAQSDKLDISDLLTGSTYQAGISHIEDYVKVDHTTGNVFVDSTGHGSFAAANQIATINNISSIDTVNIVLDHNEGTKTVHTT